MYRVEASSDSNVSTTLIDERFPFRSTEQANSRTLDAIATMAPAPELAVHLHRHAQPLNDFQQSNLIYYGGFPSTFPLGQGCGLTNSPLSTDERNFILHHFLRIATNQRLLVLMHNVKFRCDNGRVQKALVRTDRQHGETLLNVVNAPDFQARMTAAQQNPTGPEARSLLHDVIPSIMIGGAKIPFSPLERGTRASSELFAMVRFFSYPSAFFTFGLDETRTALVARLAISNHPKETLKTAAFQEYPSTEHFWNASAAHGDPSDFGEIASTLPSLVRSLGPEIEIWRKDIGNAIINDPVAVALMGQRILDGINEALFGVQHDRKSKKSPKFNNSTKTRGICGKAFAFFYVHELTGMVIHYLLCCCI
jgi:hypothetical protein